MQKFKFLPIQKTSNLPKGTGVYCFKNGKRVLYVGKANNIKERVKNHFWQPTYRDNLFINQAKRIGYIKTNSEIEALVWEANLIKKYRPKYNVVWRDDKNYFYVGITREDFPRIFITHQVQCNGKRSRYIGPFVDGKTLKLALKNLRKVLPYRTCKILPKKPCLWYQLSRCPAPCLAKSNLANQIPDFGEKIKKECQENVRNLIKILRGGEIQVLKNLKREMKEASAFQDFEGAAKIRDQIAALERVLAHAQIFETLPYLPPEWKKTEKELKKLLGTKKAISRIEAYDISNLQGKTAAGSMVASVEGTPNKNFYRKFKIKYANSARSDKDSRNANAHMQIEKPNDIAMIKEVLKRRFGHPEWGRPDLILIDGGRSQLNAALTVLKNQRKSVYPPKFSKKTWVGESAGISVLALAKKKNELFVENKKEPILLKTLPREIFNLILQLRDEAHRFAISYHRKLRKMKLIEK